MVAPGGEGPQVSPPPRVAKRRPTALPLYAPPPERRRKDGTRPATRRALRRPRCRTALRRALGAAPFRRQAFRNPYVVDLSRGSTPLPPRLGPGPSATPASSSATSLAVATDSRRRRQQECCLRHRGRRRHRRGHRSGAKGLRGRHRPRAGGFRFFALPPVGEGMLREAAPGWHPCELSAPQRGVGGRQWSKNG